MDRIMPEQRRKNMQAIKSKNSKIELLIGKAMWAKGYRYRKHNKTVFGKPDFSFKKNKLAIFCDSDFWHGKDFEKLKQKIQTNKSYWIPKIERNMERDKEVNVKLKNDGWVVLRFWENEIKNNIEDCLDLIHKAFRKA